MGESKTCAMCGKGFVGRVTWAVTCGGKCSRKREQEREQERRRERYASEPEYRERMKERMKERYRSDPKYQERLRVKGFTRRGLAARPRVVLAERKCEVCGCEFVPKRWNQKFCCHTCSYPRLLQSNRDRERARCSADPEYRKCKLKKWSTAGKEKVAAKRRAMRTAIGQTIQHCGRCGNAFTADRVLKYCGIKCRKAAGSIQKAKRYAADPRLRAQQAERQREEWMKPEYRKRHTERARRAANEKNKRAFLARMNQDLQQFIKEMQCHQQSSPPTHRTTTNSGL